MPDMTDSRHGMLPLNFLRRHSWRQTAGLLAEEYLGVLTRSFPGFEGMTLRYLVLKLTAARVGGFCYLYRGVTLTHTYGLRVGREFHVNTGAHLDARGGITVGDDVLVGPNSVLVSSDHAINVAPGQTRASAGHTNKPVLIGSHVWIGANCVVRGGVTVGDHSIIASGAVVVKDVEPFTIVGGNPAVVIRRLTEPE